MFGQFVILLRGIECGQPILSQIRIKLYVLMDLNVIRDVIGRGVWLPCDAGLPVEEGTLIFGFLFKLIFFPK